MKEIFNLNSFKKTTMLNYINLFIKYESTDRNQDLITTISYDGTQYNYQGHSK